MSTLMLKYDWNPTSAVPIHGFTSMSFSMGSTSGIDAHGNCNHLVD